jgi:hypothetical protein
VLRIEGAGRASSPHLVSCMSQRGCLKNCILMAEGLCFRAGILALHAYIHTYDVEEAADRTVSEVSSGVLVGSLFYEAVSVTRLERIW